MQIPLLSGREFTDQDNPSAPYVAVINETMAKRYWPDGNAVGQRVMLPRSEESLEIVGIAGDVRRVDLEAQVEPEIYWPNLQQTRWAAYFVLRTSQIRLDFCRRCATASRKLTRPCRCSGALRWIL